MPPKSTRWNTCVDQAKRVILVEFLEAANWNTADAANLMQLSSAQVLKLMRQHDIAKPKKPTKTKKRAKKVTATNEAPLVDDLDPPSKEPESTDETPTLTAIDGGLDD